MNNLILERINLKNRTIPKRKHLKRTLTSKNVWERQLRKGKINKDSSEQTNVKGEFEMANSATNRNVYVYEK